MKTQIGQCLMIGFEEKVLSRETVSFIRDCRIGGVILFRRNIDNLAQLNDLTKALRETDAEDETNSPLLIAVDQEWGPVTRITEGITSFPGNHWTGGIEDPAEAERSAYYTGLITGKELRSLGINLVLAPVLDLAEVGTPMYDRSYSDDPVIAGALGAAYIKGIREAGIACCAKHFPGLGDCRIDTHNQFPVIYRSEENMSAASSPFATAIRAGAPGIMVSHACYPDLDAEERPAVFSPAIVTELLKRKLGFGGAVFTDDLLMGAITTRHEPGQAAVSAMKSGADLFLVCRHLEAQRDVVGALVGAVEENVIPKERLNEAYRRVSALKSRLAPFEDTDYREICRSPEHLEIAERIAELSGWSR